MGEVTLCNFLNLLFSRCCNKWLSSVNDQYIFMLSHLIFSYLNDAVFGQNCKVVKNSCGLANSALQLPGGFDLFSRRSSLNTKSLKTATKQIQTKKRINEYINKKNKHKNQPTKQKNFFSMTEILGICSFHILKDQIPSRFQTELETWGENDV